MVILQLVTKRQYRGAEVFASELCSLLSGNKHDVIYAGLYEAPSNVLEAKGARNVDLNGKKKGFSISLLRKLMALIKETNPDIIQANGSDTLKYAVFAKIFNPKLRIVYRNISMVSAWAKEASFKRRFNRWLFKRVNRVTSVGQQSLTDLVKTYDFPAEKTKLIRRGIPELAYDRHLSRQLLAREFGFGGADPVLVHIGQLSPEKNHVFMIEAFERVLHNLPNTRLLFVGEGKLEAELKSLVQSKNLSKHIFFTGHRQNVQEIVSGSDIFILGSTIEGVPGVVLEAAMQGVPAIAVEVGGVGEVVKNGQTGILIEKHDTAKFSYAITGLLQNESLRNTFGQNAKNFVMEKYGLQNCLLQFEQLYREVINEA